MNSYKSRLKGSSSQHSGQQRGCDKRNDSFNRSEIEDDSSEDTISGSDADNNNDGENGSEVSGNGETTACKKVSLNNNFSFLSLISIFLSYIHT